MSSNTLLILPKLLKERSSLHENVDDKLIYPEIKAAQDMYIMPLLGSTLMNKLQTDIAAGTLSGNYKLLMYNYLIDTIVNYVLSELPEGLKALFRPITVMVPDLVLICENMLMAEGFTQAKVLASKFYGLYSLLRDLLSKQLHYDG
jgi:hypothetical protein